MKKTSTPAASATAKATSLPSPAPSGTKPASGFKEIDYNGVKLPTYVGGKGETPAVPRGDYALYERYVAIDNVGGWPQITILPNGDLAMLIWPEPTHGHTVGAVGCWLSSDGGRLWKRAGTPVQNEPGTNRFNHAAGIRHDGAYVAFVAGWNERYPVGWKPDYELNRQGAAWGYFSKAKTLDPIPAVSHDGGHTWKQFGVHTEPRQPSGWALTPYGRIIQLPGNELGLIMYCDECSYFTSKDGGETWQKRGEITNSRKHTEAALIRLANGDLYAAIRTFADWHIDGFRSTDGGATWQFERELTLPMQHPGDFTVLADGRLLLSYGIRTTNRWAIEARIADPEARNWSAPLTIVDLEGGTDRPELFNPTRDGGYPTTVLLPDGTLVTAYYSRGMPTHNRYHVGVVRWKLPVENRPPDRKE